MAVVAPIGLVSPLTRGSNTGFRATTVSAPVLRPVGPITGPGNHPQATPCSGPIYGVRSGSSANNPTVGFPL